MSDNLTYTPSRRAIQWRVETYNLSKEIDMPMWEDGTPATVELVPVSWLPFADAQMFARIGSQTNAALESGAMSEADAMVTSFPMLAKTIVKWNIPAPPDFKDALPQLFDILYPVEEGKPMQAIRYDQLAPGTDRAIEMLPARLIMFLVMKVSEGDDIPLANEKLSRPTTIPFTPPPGSVLVPKPIEEAEATMEAMERAIAESRDPKPTSLTT